MWASSPAGKLSIEVMSEDFPPRVVETLGRQIFANKSDAKQEYEQHTHELVPYMAEMKKVQAKKAAEWKRTEKEADVSSRVPAYIKEHEVIMNYLL